MKRTARESDSPEAIKQRLLNEAIAMLDEDNRVCRAIGEHGAKLLAEISADAQSPLELLTHCNAGGLATVQYGTALAPIYVGAERGMKFHVWSLMSLLPTFSRAAEYLPASCTAGERYSIVTVICDNMAATVMAQGKVKAVIVGTDRVAANGDVANKIGTLGVAVLAEHFGIPFFVAAPTSSIDLSLSSGAQIPIEQRPSAEISNSLGRRTAPENVDIYNPAFDVTPHNLVTAIITENGIARPPYRESLARLCANEGQELPEPDAGSTSAETFPG